mgnify:FL=1
MILRENGTRFCADGKVFTIGGRISANGESEYEGLFGTITEIRSGADRETENDTPDIYCDFETPASEEMLRELEARFSDLYGETKTIDDISLDCVIMSPDMLEPLDTPPGKREDIRKDMDAAADIFAQVLQMPDGDLRALRAFSCAPADEEATSWEVVTEVCSLGGCDMRAYSFKDERSARVFAALMEHTGCRLRYKATCPSCYTEYQKDILKESEDL